MNINKLQQDVNLQVNEEMTVGNYRAYDFRLARYMGLEPAIMLTYLCDQDKFINKLNVGKEFYKQQKYIEFFTGLTSKQQNLALKKLKQLEIIDVIKKGMPAKNHFKINYKKIRDIKKLVVDDFYGEIEKFDYYKHEFDTEEEIIKNANKNTIQLSISSAAETSALDLPKRPHINNKEINNLDSSNNILSKDNNILEVNSKELTFIGSSNINNIEYNHNKIFSNTDSVESAPKKRAGGVPPKETKPKGGLAPLIDMAEKKFDKTKYPTLNIGLKTYLKAHVGCRRLPSIEKWEDMLNRLEEYSSIKLVATSGTKFLENNAIVIVEKAINLKGDAPYPDFDNIFNVKLEKNNFDFSNIKGY